MTRKSPRPTAAPPQGGEATDAPDVRGFEVELSCPHCGGPFVVSDATVSHTCEHCRSLLIVQAPDREEVFVEPPRLKSAADLLDTLLRYRIDAHRASLIAQYSSEDGLPPSEFLIAPFLNRFEKQLRATARIVDFRLIHVPYRQTSGKVVQAVLGRRGDGPKTARLRAYTAEQTSPAYDASRFNLRDAGLRLGKSIFKPLLSADVARLGRFLPRAAADGSRRELEKWRGQNLEPGFEAVAKQGEVVITFEATVYRPYYLVSAVLDRKGELILVDGGFGAIAGYPTPDECDTLMKVEDVDPLGTTGASFRHLAIVPARCPNCGADPQLVDDAIISVCENCHAGLMPSTPGLVLTTYDREEGVTPARETAMLPFWRFPFEVSAAGSPPIRDLETYAKTIFPQGPPQGFSPRGSFIYVPAWRLLTTQPGDETFAELSRAFHANPWHWTPDRLGLEVRPRFVPVSLPEEDARALAWAALFTLHTKPSAARLNTLVLKRTLFDARLSLGASTVALVAFTASGDSYAGAGVRVPRLVVDGGPLLAAQRVSVHKARGAR